MSSMEAATTELMKIMRMPTEAARAEHLNRWISQRIVKLGSLVQVEPGTQGDNEGQAVTRKYVDEQLYFGVASEMMKKQIGERERDNASSEQDLTEHRLEIWVVR